MNTTLNWRNEAGLLKADSLGANYQVWSDSSTGVKLWFRAIVFGGQRTEGLSQSEDKAKHKCQIHHDALVDAVQSNK